jgi:hypothetical protein
MFTEAKTRKALIDPALRKAGWDVDDPRLVGLEIPVDGTDASAWRALRARLKELGGNFDANVPSGAPGAPALSADG